MDIEFRKQFIKKVIANTVRDLEDVEPKVAIYEDLFEEILLEMCSEPFRFTRNSDFPFCYNERDAFRDDVYDEYDDKACYMFVDDSHIDEDDEEAYIELERSKEENETALRTNFISALSDLITKSAHDTLTKLTGK